MPAPSPYRSRLFQSVHHHSVRTARRAQRAWREIRAVASLGVQAVKYSFQRLWQIVQASHLQMPAAPHQARLETSSDSSVRQPTNSSSKAVARILSLARSLSLLEGNAKQLPLQAPPLYSASQYQLSESQSSNDLATRPLPVAQSTQVSTASNRVAVRAIASQLEDRHLVLVTRHNGVLDCLTAGQQAAISQRIDAELALLAATPQPVQIVAQPRTWQESISRLALPAQRLRQLPAATERLLQAPIEHWQRLSRTASGHPLTQPLRELVTRIPGPKQATEIATQLALPPARQLVNLTAHLAAQLPKPALPPVVKRAEPLVPSPTTVVVWKQHLQQQFQTLWHQSIRGDVQSQSTKYSLPSRAEAILEALPISRSAWATRLLKPFRRPANPWPDLNAVKRAEAPVLPPSPPQPLLKPATIGFLRPAARGYVVLSRAPQDSLARSRTAGHEFRPESCSPKEVLPKAALSSSPVAAASSRATPAEARSPKQQRHKRSTLKKRSKQRQAATNTYIDVDATDLGYDTSMVSRGVDWLDRGVYAIEESALKAWQWWCELVEPEGAPKPINTFGATQEGRELLVAGTRRSQDIVVASAELGVALFQELWPLMWHLLQVLCRRASQAAFRLMQWVLSVALPIATRLVTSLLRFGADWVGKLQSNQQSRQ